MPDLRVYASASGQERTFYFPFLDPDSTDGDFLQSTPTLASGDATIMKDGAAFGNTSATPVWEGNGYGSIALTGTEMTAKIVVVVIRDQTATREWVTTSIIIHTGGHASALHSG